MKIFLELSEDVRPDMSGVSVSGRLVMLHFRSLESAERTYKAFAMSGGKCCMTGANSPVGITVVIYL